MDIENYLKTLDQFDHLKSIFLNYYQKLSLEYLKKINLYNEFEREELAKEFNLLNRKQYKEKDLDEIMALILYYIDLLKDNNKTKESLIDKKIINRLNPLLKDLIKDYDKNRRKDFDNENN